MDTKDLEELFAAAEAGNADAQNNLGVMYDNGQGVPQANKTAVKWYTLAAKQGDAPAQFNLGYMYARGRGVPQNYKTTVKWYTLAAEQGNARAQYNLGVMYADGQGVPQDDKTAVKWYTLAAEQGTADERGDEAAAQNNLGVMYDAGRGVPQDYKTAVKWFTLAAEQGDETGQNNLGLMYANGNGVPRDYKTAVKWYTLAAEQGNARAQNNLGNMHANGEGVPQDDKTAVKWYSFAAEQGDETGQNNLGLRYYKGQGVPRNYKTAVKWWTLAAEQGNAEAAAKTGYAYYHGHGVKKDYKKAVEWANRAVAGPPEWDGDPLGDFVMGLAYFFGRGVERDLRHAHVLFTLAGDEGVVEGNHNAGVMGLGRYAGAGDLAENSAIRDNHLFDEDFPDETAEYYFNLSNLDVSSAALALVSLEQALADEPSDLQKRLLETTKRYLEKLCESSWPGTLTDVIETIASLPTSTRETITRLRLSLAEAKKAHPTEHEDRSIIENEEGLKHEYKASLRIPYPDYPTKQKDEQTGKEFWPFGKEKFQQKKQLWSALEGRCVKAICSFLNTKGGVLVIGVHEEGNQKKLVGIGRELQDSKNIANNDDYQRHLLGLIQNEVAANVVSECIDITFEHFDGHDVCVVGCQASKDIVLFQDDLYVRQPGKVVKLSLKESLAFAKERQL